MHKVYILNTILIIHGILVIFQRHIINKLQLHSGVCNVRLFQVENVVTLRRRNKGVPQSVLLIQCMTSSVVQLEAQVQLETCLQLQRVVQTIGYFVTICISTQWLVYRILGVDPYTLRVPTPSLGRRPRIPFSDQPAASPSAPTVIQYTS